MTGVPSGALISGTPKKARKYIEAVSSSISRPGRRSVTSASCHASPATLSAVTQSELEATDRKILELLANDGRMSFTDLGKATGLSTSAVHQRVKRLESRGLIQGYGARSTTSSSACR